VSISKGGCESLRTAVTATIATIPPAPSTYGGSSCGPGSITLGAVTAVSPPTNLTHRWYDQNGNLISGPVSQTSPTTGVATTYTATFYQPITTYYVATYNTSTGCESARTLVTATVQSSPCRLLSTETASEGGAGVRQNVPNPAEGITRIHYRIPVQAHQAQLSLYSAKGELLQSFPITQRGEGQLSLDTTPLPEGVYLYRLLVDGKQIDTKKLLRLR
jgi:hypothetical protein